jgi:hypothetical protein
MFWQNSSPTRSTTYARTQLGLSWGAALPVGMSYGNCGGNQAILGNRGQTGNAPVWGGDVALSDDSYWSRIADVLGFSEIATPIFSVGININSYYYSGNGNSHYENSYLANLLRKQNTYINKLTPDFNGSGIVNSNQWLIESSNSVIEFGQNLAGMGTAISLDQAVSVKEFWKLFEQVSKWKVTDSDLGLQSIVSSELRINIPQHLDRDYILDKKLSASQIIEILENIKEYINNDERLLDQQTFLVFVKEKLIQSVTDKAKIIIIRIFCYRLCCRISCSEDLRERVIYSGISPPVGRSSVPCRTREAFCPQRVGEFFDDQIICR